MQKPGYGESTFGLIQWSHCSVLISAGNTDGITLAKGKVNVSLAENKTESREQFLKIISLIYLFILF